MTRAELHAAYDRALIRLAIDRISNQPPIPPRLWEDLRRQLQAIYRQATGEPTAVLSIDIPKVPHDPL